MSKSAYIFLFFLAFVAVLGFHESNSKINEPNRTTQKQINYDWSKIKDGDIIFQSSQSPQSRAIQLATKSAYSHVGIIFKNNDNYFVLEAIQPVKLTPIKEWIKRGEAEHFVIKRLKDDEKLLTKEKLVKLRAEGEKYVGKNYDSFFEWSDSKIYCSELVWKVYYKALGIKLGNLQELSELDLSHPTVKQKVKERYGNNIPLTEKVISPASIFDSQFLETVL